MTTPQERIAEARDIRAHCLALIILKATGCTEEQAFKAGDDCYRYWSLLRSPSTAPVAEQRFSNQELYEIIYSIPFSWAGYHNGKYYIGSASAEEFARGLAEKGFQIIPLASASVADGREPPLTCPHIDAFIAKTNPPADVLAELDAIKRINSGLRYGLWHEKERVHTFELELRALKSSSEQGRNVTLQEASIIANAERTQSHERSIRAVTEEDRIYYKGMRDAAQNIEIAIRALIGSAPTGGRDAGLEEAKAALAKIADDLDDAFEPTNEFIVASNEELREAAISSIKLALSTLRALKSSASAGEREQELLRNSALDEAASHLRDMGYWTQGALVLDLKFRSSRASEIEQNEIHSSCGNANERERNPQRLPAMGGEPAPAGQEITSNRARHGHRPLAAGCRETGPQETSPTSNAEERKSIAPNPITGQSDARSLTPVVGHGADKSPTLIERLWEAHNSVTDNGATLYREAAEALLRAAPEGMVLVPKEPEPGRLASMALRYDHAIFAPIGGISFGPATEEERQRKIDAAISTMRQLYEEATGQGFYSSEKEPSYKAMLPAAPTHPKGER